MPDLKKSFKGLEELREEVLAGVRQLSAPQRTFRPEPDAWSSLEVIHHLVLVEQETVRFLESGREPGRRSFKHKVLHAGVRMVLASPFRVKALSQRLIPQEELPLEALEASWKKTRGDLARYLEGIPEDRFQRQVFRHPIAGPLDIVQTLGFLSRHLHHHRRQLDRIQTASGFAALS